MTISFCACVRLDFRLMDGTVCFAITRAQGRFREGRSRIIRKIGFLMYPHAETAQGRRDSLDPDTFKYTITTRKITS
jgi:hypothetical protein